jgi:hypothetical protein
VRLATIPLDRLEDWLAGERQRGCCGFNLQDTTTNTTKPKHLRQDSVKCKATYVCDLGQPKKPDKNKVNKGKTTTDA